jgi:hypothetical protein
VAAAQADSTTRDKARRQKAKDGFPVLSFVCGTRTSGAPAFPGSAAACAHFHYEVPKSSGQSRRGQSEVRMAWYDNACASLVRFCACVSMHICVSRKRARLTRKQQQQTQFISKRSTAHLNFELCLNFEL